MSMAASLDFAALLDKYLAETDEFDGWSTRDDYQPAFGMPEVTDRTSHTLELAWPAARPDSRVVLPGLLVDKSSAG